MKKRDYLKYCSKIILKKIYDLTSDENVEKYYHKYCKYVKDDEEVDDFWLLISTALLLSEHLNQNESLYKKINENNFEKIKNAIYSTESFCTDEDKIENIYHDSEEFNTNYLLDENNNIINPIMDFDYVREFYQEYEKDRNFEYMLNKRDIDDISEEDDGIKAYYDKLLKPGFAGCNDSILTDDKIDFSKFVLRVRHAFAHSNYEVINKNLIRLYHKNNETNKLDFNVILNKDFIIVILDELNEIFDEISSNFINEWYDFKSSFNEKEYVKASVVIDKIKELKLFLEEDIEDILNHALKKDSFNLLYNSEQLDDIETYMFEKIKPICSYGLMINEITYGNDGGIIDDKYYDKLGEYSYFASNNYDANIKSNKAEFLKHILELLIFSFLNSTILNTINLKSNGFDEMFDFNKMYVDDEFIKIAESRTKVINDVELQIDKRKGDLNRLNNYIEENKKLLVKYKDSDIQYYKETLPDILKAKEEIKKEIEEEILSLTNKKTNAKYYEFSNYILSHMRNSLAHGYVKINGDLDVENIMDTVLEFRDYNPDTKEKTFNGRIKLSDLLDVLICDKYMKHAVLVKKI